VYVHRVRAVAVAFWLLFNAYSSAQLLQSSLNGNAGYACLATLYGIFAVAAVFSPTIVARYGTQVLLPLSAVPYVIMVGVNLSPSLASLIPSCAGVGGGAATLWSSQGMYVGANANAYAAATGTALTDATSLLNARFYAIFASAGGTSALLSAAVLNFVPDGRRILFLLLGAVAATALVLFSSLVDPSTAAATHSHGILQVPPPVARCWQRRRAWRPSEAPPPLPSPALPRPPVLSPTFMLRFLATDRRTQHLAAALFMTGCGMGVFNGVWMAALVARGVGTGYVPLIGAVYSFASAAATTMWGRLTLRRGFGRRWAMVVATVLQTATMAASAVLAHAYLDADGDGTLPAGLGIPALTIMSIAWAIGDSVWFSQLPATLQTYFPTGPEAPCAMATVRLFTAAGFGLTSAAGPFLRHAVAAQCALQALALAAAGGVLWHMHTRVCSIDYRAPPPPLPSVDAVAATTLAAAAVDAAAIAPAPTTCKE